MIPSWPSGEKRRKELARWNDFFRLFSCVAGRASIMTPIGFPMSEPKPSETTRLLRDWANGDQSALDRLTPRVYQELRRVAGHFMRHESPGRTLQATALVHEAYLKLIEVDNVGWEHRAHFFAVASQIMRRIL